MPMTREKRDILLEYRVKQLEEGYASLDQKIDLILSNHLPHLEARMISLETRINVMTAINVGAVIIGIIVTNVIK